MRDKVRVEEYMYNNIFGRCCEELLSIVLSSVVVKV